MSGKLTRIPPVQPITIGHFTLTATGMDVKGKPSFEEYEGVGDFINRAHKASGFWLGDWLRYGESRSDWSDRLSQAQHITGLSEKTLKNVRAVAGSIEPSRRRDDIEFGLHEVVARLDADDQTRWLDKAQAEGWGVRELRTEIRAASRTKIIEGQAHLEGMYRVIYADPPWKYNDSAPFPDGSHGKAERSYPGMSIEELCKLPVEAHALPDAVLFMWVTTPFLLLNPGPREVLEAWGFTYKSAFAWDKVLGVPGNYVHVTHEHLIIATRGSCLPDAPTPAPKSVQVERRSEVHSAKPESFRKIIERLYIYGPFLELFGREKVEGWDVFGNDARLWAEEIAQ